jgi:hypothetical protein
MKKEEAPDRRIEGFHSMQNTPPFFFSIVSDFSGLFPNELFHFNFQQYYTTTRMLRLKLFFGS